MMMLVISSINITRNSILRKSFIGCCTDCDVGCVGYVGYVGYVGFKIISDSLIYLTSEVLDSIITTHS